MSISATKRDEAVKEAMRVAKKNDSEWLSTAGAPYVSEAGWYFKTLAVQEIGEIVNFHATRILHNQLRFLFKF